MATWTDTSIIISMLKPDGSGSTSKSIKQIRSDAPTDKIIRWAKKMVSVTENTYVSTSIVHKIKLD